MSQSVRSSKRAASPEIIKDLLADASESLARVQYANELVFTSDASSEVVIQSEAYCMTLELNPIIQNHRDLQSVFRTGSSTGLAIIFGPARIRQPLRDLTDRQIKDMVKRWQGPDSLSAKGFRRGPYSQS